MALALTTTATTTIGIFSESGRFIGKLDSIDPVKTTLASLREQIYRSAASAALTVEGVNIPYSFTFRNCRKREAELITRVHTLFPKLTIRGRPLNALMKPEVTGVVTWELPESAASAAATKKETSATAADAKSSNGEGDATTPVVPTSSKTKLLTLVVVVADNPLGDPVLQDRLRLGIDAPGRRVPAHLIDTLLFSNSDDYNVSPSYARAVLLAEDTCGTPLLHELATSGSNLAIEKLVTHLSASPSSRSSPLFSATPNSFVDKLDSATGRTALYHAASRGLVSTVQCLLSAGANPLLGWEKESDTSENDKERRPLEKERNEAICPLSIAIDNRHDAVVDVICEHVLLLLAGNQNSCAFPEAVCRRFVESAPSVHQLAFEGDVEAMQFLTSHPLYKAAAAAAAATGAGAATNGEHAPSVVTSKSVANAVAEGKGATPLHAAARGGSVAAVEFLIDQCGMQPDAVDCFGCGPIFYAAEKGHAAVVRSLVLLGASVSRLNYVRRSPLFVAIANGNASCVEELFKGLEAQTDGQQQVARVGDNSGETLATLCASLGQVAYLQRLFKLCGRGCVWVRSSLKMCDWPHSKLPSKIEALRKRKAGKIAQTKARSALMSCLIPLKNTSLVLVHQPQHHHSQQASSPHTSSAPTSSSSSSTGTHLHRLQARTRSRLECALLICESYVNGGMSLHDLPESTDELIECIACALLASGSWVGSGAASSSASVSYSGSASSSASASALGFRVAKILLSIFGSSMATEQGVKLFEKIFEMAAEFSSSLSSASSSSSSSSCSLSVVVTSAVRWLCECKVASDPPCWKLALEACCRMSHHSKNVECLRIMLSPTVSAHGIHTLPGWLEGANGDDLCAAAVAGACGKRGSIGDGNDDDAATATDNTTSLHLLDCLFEHGALPSRKTLLAAAKRCDARIFTKVLAAMFSDVVGVSSSASSTAAYSQHVHFHSRSISISSSQYQDQPLAQQPQHQQRSAPTFSASYLLLDPSLTIDVCRELANSIRTSSNDNQERKRRRAEAAACFTYFFNVILEKDFDAEEQQKNDPYGVSRPSSSSYSIATSLVWSEKFVNLFHDDIVNDPRVIVGSDCQDHHQLSTVKMLATVAPSSAISSAQIVAAFLRLIQSVQEKSARTEFAKQLVERSQKSSSRDAPVRILSCLAHLLTTASTSSAPATSRGVGKASSYANRNELYVFSSSLVTSLSAAVSAEDLALNFLADLADGGFFATTRAVPQSLYALWMNYYYYYHYYYYDGSSSTRNNVVSSTSSSAASSKSVGASAAGASNNTNNTCQVLCALAAYNYKFQADCQKLDASCFFRFASHSSHHKNDTNTNSCSGSTSSVSATRTIASRAAAAANATRHHYLEKAFSERSIVFVTRSLSRQGFHVEAASVIEWLYRFTKAQATKAILDEGDDEINDTQVKKNSARMATDKLVVNFFVAIAEIIFEAGKIGSVPLVSVCVETLQDAVFAKRLENTIYTAASQSSLLLAHPAGSCVAPSPQDGDQKNKNKRSSAGTIKVDEKKLFVTSESLRQQLLDTLAEVIVRDVQQPWAVSNSSSTSPTSSVALVSLLLPHLLSGSATAMTANVPSRICVNPINRASILCIAALWGSPSVMREVAESYFICGEGNYGQRNNNNNNNKKMGTTVISQHEISTFLTGLTTLSGLALKKRIGDIVQNVIILFEGRTDDDNYQADNESGVNAVAQEFGKETLPFLVPLAAKCRRWDLCEKIFDTIVLANTHHHQRGQQSDRHDDNDDDEEGERRGGKGSHNSNSTNDILLCEYLMSKMNPNPSSPAGPSSPSFSSSTALPLFVKNAWIELFSCILSSPSDNCIRQLNRFAPALQRLNLQAPPKADDDKTSRNNKSSGGKKFVVDGSSHRLPVVTCAQACFLYAATYQRGQLRALLRNRDKTVHTDLLLPKTDEARMVAAIANDTPYRGSVFTKACCVGNVAVTRTFAKLAGQFKVVRDYIVDTIHDVGVSIEADGGERNPEGEGNPLVAAFQHGATAVIADAFSPSSGGSAASLTGGVSSSNNGTWPDILLRALTSPTNKFAIEPRFVSLGLIRSSPSCCCAANNATSATFAVLPLAQHVRHFKISWTSAPKLRTSLSKASSSVIIDDVIEPVTWRFETSNCLFVSDHPLDVAIMFSNAATVAELLSTPSMLDGVGKCTPESANRSHLYGSTTSRFGSPLLLALTLLEKLGASSKAQRSRLDKIVAVLAASSLARDMARRGGKGEFSLCLSMMIYFGQFSSALMMMEHVLYASSSSFALPSSAGGSKQPQQQQHAFYPLRQDALTAQPPQPLKLFAERFPHPIFAAIAVSSACSSNSSSVDSNNYGSNGFSIPPTKSQHIPAELFSKILTATPKSTLQFLKNASGHTALGLAILYKNSQRADEILRFAPELLTAPCKFYNNSSNNNNNSEACEEPLSLLPIMYCVVTGSESIFNRCAGLLSSSSRFIVGLSSSSSAAAPHPPLSRLKDRLGRSILHVACSKGMTTIVEKLISLALASSSISSSHSSNSYPAADGEVQQQQQSGEDLLFKTYSSAKRRGSSAMTATAFSNVEHIVGNNININSNSNVVVVADDDFLVWNCASVAAVSGHDTLALSLVQHWHVPVLPNLLSCAIWGNCESLVNWILQNAPHLLTLMMMCPSSSSEDQPHHDSLGTDARESEHDPAEDRFFISPLQLSECMGRIGITRKLHRFLSHQQQFQSHPQLSQQHHFNSFNITGWFKNAMMIASRMLQSYPANTLATATATTTSNNTSNSNNNRSHHFTAERDFPIYVSDGTNTNSRKRIFDDMFEDEDEFEVVDGKLKKKKKTTSILKTKDAALFGVTNSNSNLAAPFADVLFKRFCQTGNTVGVRALADFVGVDRCFGLHAAAACGHLDVCRLLLSLGCSNVMVVDHKGLTAFEEAVCHGKTHVAEYLFAQLVSSTDAEAAEQFVENRILDVLRRIVEASQHTPSIAALISKIAQIAAERNWSKHMLAALRAKSDSYVNFAPLESALILGCPEAVMRLLAAQHAVSKGAAEHKRIVLSDAALSLVSSPLSCFKPSSRVLLFDVFGVHEASFREVDTAASLLRLSFADVRLIGVNQLFSDDYVRSCIESIFTIKREAAIFESLWREPLGPIPSSANVDIAVDWNSVPSAAAARCLSTSLVASRFRYLPGFSSSVGAHPLDQARGGESKSRSGSMTPTKIQINVVSEASDVAAIYNCNQEQHHHQHQQQQQQQGQQQKGEFSATIQDFVCFFDTGRLLCLSAPMTDFQDKYYQYFGLSSTTRAEQLAQFGQKMFNERCTNRWKQKYSKHPILSLGKFIFEFDINSYNNSTATDSSPAASSSLILSEQLYDRCKKTIKEAYQLFSSVEFDSYSNKVASLREYSCEALQHAVIVQQQQHQSHNDKRASPSPSSSSTRPASISSSAAAPVFVVRLKVVSSNHGSAMSSKKVEFVAHGTSSNQQIVAAVWNIFVAASTCMDEREEMNTQDEVDMNSDTALESATASLFAPSLADCIRWLSRVRAYVQQQAIEAAYYTSCRAVVQTGIPERCRLEFCSEIFVDHSDLCNGNNPPGKRVAPSEPGVFPSVISSAVTTVGHVFAQLQQHSGLYNTTRAIKVKVTTSSTAKSSRSRLVYFDGDADENSAAGDDGDNEGEDDKMQQEHDDVEASTNKSSKQQQSQTSGATLVLNIICSPQTLLHPTASEIHQCVTDRLQAEAIQHFIEKQIERSAASIVKDRFKTLYPACVLRVRTNMLKKIATKRTAVADILAKFDDPSSSLASQPSSAAAAVDGNITHPILLINSLANAFARIRTETPFGYDFSRNVLKRVEVVFVESNYIKIKRLRVFASSNPDPNNTTTTTNNSDINNSISHLQQQQQQQNQQQQRQHHLEQFPSLHLRCFIPLLKENATGNSRFEALQMTNEWIEEIISVLPPSFLLSAQLQHEQKLLQQKQVVTAAPCAAIIDPTRSWLELHHLPLKLHSGHLHIVVILRDAFGSEVPATEMLTALFEDLVKKHPTRKSNVNNDDDDAKHGDEETSCKSITTKQSNKFKVSLQWYVDDDDAERIVNQKNNNCHQRQHQHRENGDEDESDEDADTFLIASSSVHVDEHYNLNSSSNVMIKREDRIVFRVSVPDKLAQVLSSANRNVGARLTIAQEPQQGAAPSVATTSTVIIGTIPTHAVIFSSKSTLRKWEWKGSAATNGRNQPLLGAASALSDNHQLHHHQLQQQVEPESQKQHSSNIHLFNTCVTGREIKIPIVLTCNPAWVSNTAAASASSSSARAANKRRRPSIAAASNNIERMYQTTYPKRFEFEMLPADEENPENRQLLKLVSNSSVNLPSNRTKKREQQLHAEELPQQQSPVDEVNANTPATPDNAKGEEAKKRAAPKKKFSRGVSNDIDSAKNVLTLVPPPFKDQHSNFEIMRVAVRVKPIYDDDDDGRHKQQQSEEFCISFDVVVWSEELFGDWQKACRVELEDGMWKLIAQRPSELEKLIDGRQTRALDIFVRKAAGGATALIKNAGAVISSTSTSPTTTPTTTATVPASPTVLERDLMIYNFPVNYFTRRKNIALREAKTPADLVVRIALPELAAVAIP